MISFITSIFFKHNLLIGILMTSIDPKPSIITIINLLQANGESVKNFHSMHALKRSMLDCVFNCNENVPV